MKFKNKGKMFSVEWVLSINWKTKIRFFSNKTAKEELFLNKWFFRINRDEILFWSFIAIEGKRQRFHIPKWNVERKSGLLEITWSNSLRDNFWSSSMSPSFKTYEKQSMIIFFKSTSIHFKVNFKLFQYSTFSQTDSISSWVSSFWVKSLTTFSMSDAPM